MIGVLSVKIVQHAVDATTVKSVTNATLVSNVKNVQIVTSAICVLTVLIYTIVNLCIITNR